MRVIGYVRVSTEEQASGGFSLELQEKKIRDYCALYELELDRIVSDPGFSAKTLDRPGITDILNTLRGRKSRVDGLVISKLDRLTRSIGDWSNLIKEFFRDEKKRLFSVGDQIDTRTANGRMVLNLIMTIAEWEREVIGERTRDALQQKIRRGERCGKVRFGYDLGPDGVGLVPNEREQETIAMMRAWDQLRRKHKLPTYRDMVAFLEELGIDTKDGGIWRPATIRQILIRPTG